MAYFFGSDCSKKTTSICVMDRKALAASAGLRG